MFSNIIEDIRNSIETFTKSNKVSLVKITYDEKCFGNKIIDLLISELYFQIVCDRDFISVYVCSKHQTNQIYHLEDILNIQGIACKKYESLKYLEALPLIVNLILENSLKINQFFDHGKGKTKSKINKLLTSPECRIWISGRNENR